MNTASLFPILLSLCAAIFEFFMEKKEEDGEILFRRSLAIFVSLAHIIFFLLTLFAFPEVLSIDEELQMSLSFSEFPPLHSYGLSHWGLLFCLLQSFVLCAGSLLSPRYPSVRVRMSHVYCIHSLLLLLGMTLDVRIFLFIAIILYLMLMESFDYHRKKISEDSKKVLRGRVFKLYHGLTVLGLCIAFLDTFISTDPSAVGIFAISLSAFVALGIFPFHSWVVPFLGAPRNTIFLPLFVVEGGILIFFRLYIPVLQKIPALFFVGLVCGVIGLLYSAISFFREIRLKRIPGYLYLSHVCLMVIGVNGLGVGGQLVSLVDSLNLIVALCGLVAVCSLLTARLGVKGVLFPTGLASSFPELAVCYLICTLSLVGFPGTIGFIQEEIMLGVGVNTHIVFVIIITTALTLNGFSCFRLFARVFYGPRLESIDKSMALAGRERAVLWFLIFLLLVNGFAPKVLLSFLVG